MSKNNLDGVIINPAVIKRIDKEKRKGNLRFLKFHGINFKPKNTKELSFNSIPIIVEENK